MGGLYVSGKTIRHMRGDTGILEVDLVLGGESREWKDGDTALFTVKDNAGNVLLQKSMDDGKFHIEPGETAGLRPGSYVYDVEATFADGTVLTVAGPARYVLIKDVTTNEE